MTPGAFSKELGRAGGKARYDSDKPPKGKKFGYNGEMTNSIRGNSTKYKKKGISSGINAVIRVKK